MLLNKPANHDDTSVQATARCVETVRRAAEESGRDPASVRIWSCYATVHDGLPEPLRLRKTVGRMATYLQGYGDLLVGTNGWDPEPLARFRARIAEAGTTIAARNAARRPYEYLLPTGVPQSINV